MAEHPTYATCTGCTQGVRIKIDGTTRDHNRKVAAGSMLATVTCAGSGHTYAEASRREWDPQHGEFVDMPIQVPATLVPFGGGEPLDDFYVEIYSTIDTRHGYQIFEDLHMSLFLAELDDNRPLTFAVKLLDANGHTLNYEEVRDDGSINGLVLRWLSALS